MTLVTIKARAKTRRQQVDAIIQKAREKAAHGSDRVLVVYDEHAANIYFEGEPSPLPKTAADATEV